MRAPLLLFLMLVTACGQDVASVIPLPPSPPAPLPVEVAGVKIVQPALTLETGVQAMLRAIAYDGTGARIDTATIAWSSNDARVATVDTKGVVTGLAPGVAMITASAGNQSTAIQVKVAAVDSPRITLYAFPGDRTLVIGASLKIAAWVVGQDGRALPTQPDVAWNSSLAAIATVRPVPYGGNNGHNAAVTAVAGGVTTITATAGGATATLEVTVFLPPPPGPSGLAVVTFTMLEFQYPENPGLWVYAPQLRVTESAGGTVDVLGLAVTVPGFGTPPPFCGSIRLGPFESRDLNVELYGDYQISVDAGTSGRRVTAGELATAVIRYRKADGEVVDLTVTGPIVAGTLPTTYTGGYGIWGSCAIPR